MNTDTSVGMASQVAASNASYRPTEAQAIGGTQRLRADAPA